jgi:hypothetical protein
MTALNQLIELKGFILLAVLFPLLEPLSSSYPFRRRAPINSGIAADL